MTRNETLQNYNVRDGRICSLGKFEGEPIFAPHFWQCGLEGCADADNGTVYTFHVLRDAPERKEFPELNKWLGRRRALRLAEDGQGFVRCF